jgi:hypothetical protein
MSNPTPTVNELLDTIVKETMRLRYTWGNYRYLCVEDQQRVDVLSATAPDFFTWVVGLAADSVFMGIARLTDAGRANASLERLLTATGWENTDLSRWKTFSAQLAKVRATCKSCVYYRHKLLGHLDYSVALKVQPIPIVTVREVDAALDTIESFLGTVYTELRPNDSYSFRFSNGEAHVKPMIDKLMNRVSQKRPDAISTIVRTEGPDDAQLHCGFCGETAKVYMTSDDMPDARYLKHCHFDECCGLVGIESIIVEIKGKGDQIKRTTLELASPR